MKGRKEEREIKHVKERDIYKTRESFVGPGEFICFYVLKQLGARDL